MTYLVHIKPKDHLLFVNEGETVLDAAIRHGFEFPYSCQAGVCGTCAGVLLAGEIDYLEEPIGLEDDEIDAGYAFFCQAIPKSDLVIEVEGIISPEELPIITVPYTVGKHQQLTDDISQVYLHPSPESQLQYCAGQYIFLINSRGEKRPYSIANAPLGEHHIELHIRHEAENDYVNTLLSDIRNNDAIAIEGPYGRCIYRDIAEKPLLVLAGGTGFTHSKSIIEHALEINAQRPIYLYWGAQTQTDLYLQPLAQQWVEKHDNFHFIPVLSGTDTDNWTGRTGLVHAAALADFDDLSSVQVYASGPSAMVYSALQAFENKGLRREWMFSDSFDLEG